MRLEEIVEIWEEDSKLDPTRMDQHLTEIPKLHTKYTRMLNEERLRLRKMETENKKFTLYKYEHLLGTLDKETLDARGWKPNPRSILKSDIPMHMEADDETIELALKIAYQKEKVTTLESILQNVSDRKWIIRNWIEHQRFFAGM